MKSISIVGIDLSKHVFQVHGIDARGEVVFMKRLSRAGLKRFMSQLQQCIVAMESCSGSHYWGRLFESMGHEVRLIAPQFVKPYVKTNKNDMADAEAIAEAASRPGMRYVPLKQEWQQDILLLHRIRERLVRERTALTNEIRGLLHEYGIVIRKGARGLREEMRKVLAGEMKMSNTVFEAMRELHEEHMSLVARVSAYDAKIARVYATQEQCKQIGTIPGIGPITATALVASVGDAHVFKNGRQLAAWLGLVPRQHSSGGKTILFGISKRGDRYLRKMLIHGARSVMLTVERKTDRRSRWLQAKIRDRGFNKACVALANKNARTCWALMTHKMSYQCH